MKKTYNTYKKSGVNMAAADKLVNYISRISRKTYNKNTEKKSFKNIGSFGSIFDLSQLKMNNPIIVSSTDGVGTKIEIANIYKKYNTIGIDLVAMCVNDLIVQGAKPIFFLDYIAINKIKFNKVKKILLTIDDGFQSFYDNAWPFLKTKNIPFILFISTAYVGKKGYMNWEQIKEIEESGLGIIGNHSHTHEYLVDQTNNQIINDINRAIELFEKKLGYSPKYFSYPFGEYSNDFSDNTHGR